MIRHPFNIIGLSPWPFYISFNVSYCLISFIGMLSGIQYSNKLLIYYFFIILLIFSSWLNDVIIESNYTGFHTNQVTYSLLIGYLLFLITEIMLFFSFFWAYFHSALNPSYLVWPPIGIELINPWAIPLLNTLLLLYSGVFGTWAHHSFIYKNRNDTLKGLQYTILLGFIFFLFQVFEYNYASFDITDSVYGSCFYILTGTHGLHVIIGILFICIICIKVYNYQNAVLVFDLGLLYWHFVDIVWIGLYILIYYLTY